MQEMEWISIDNVVVEECEPASITDACQEIGAPVFDEKVTLIWRLRTDCLI